MNKRKLNKVFQQVKENCSLDFAIVNIDEYGDCNSCATYQMCLEFGGEAKGIWAKHWLKGMNKGPAWKYLERLYIGHDISEEQAHILIKTFEDNSYNVEPKHYDKDKCFEIWEE